MKNRCRYANKDHHERYIDRGIKVCDRWANSFENFLADMGPRPFPRAEVERIDNDKNYEPSNCRWASRKEQCRNSCVVKLITYKGETLPLVVWSERLGLKYTRLVSRLLHGWSVERAFEEPVHNNRGQSLH